MIPYFNASLVHELVAEAAERGDVDLQLVARVAKGDGDAFRDLYSVYHRRLSRFLALCVRRHDAAEEIINDTMWVVWHNAADFRGTSSVSTWIMGIAYRLVRDKLPDERSEVPSEPDQTTGETGDWLTVAVGRLPLEQRLVLELTYVLGHSCGEIAAIMDCPLDTVKARMLRARQKLKVPLPLFTELRSVSYQGVRP